MFPRLQLISRVGGAPSLRAPVLRQSEEATPFGMDSTDTGHPMLHGTCLDCPLLNSMETSHPEAWL